MVLHIAICDDNKSVIDLIKGTIANAFSSYGVGTEIETFTSPSSLNRREKELPFDILFLDIRMPEIDGVDFAKKILQEQPGLTLIFVSSREERVFDAIQVQPFGFVRKSNFLSDVSEVIERYMKSQKAKSADKIVCFNVHGKKNSFSVDDILYFEGDGVYQKMFLKNDKDHPVDVSSKMGDLEEQLTPMGFLRVHKGFLVNFFFIKSIGSDDLTLTDGSNIPIARRKATKIKEDFLQLCKKYSVLTF